MSADDASPVADPDDPPRGRSRVWVAPLLLAATIVTTTANGIWMTDAWADRMGLLHLFGFDLSDRVAPWYTDWAIWRGGLGFSAALLGILMAHEMGHWLTARYYKVPVSFPMFIPFLPPLGTMGAVIAMQPQPMTARVMMRIAAFGPFAGMVVAVPVYLLGLSWSEIRVLPGEGAQVMFLGTGLLNRALDAWMIGPIPAGHDVFLHPVAFAGWAGFYVTAFNLTPLGQLDGGHITYGLFGEHFNRAVPFIAGVLVVVGAVWQNPMWLVMVGLVAWTMGLRHPPLVTDGVARGIDRWIGIIAWVVLVLTFVPSPTLAG